jgi:hypothetical protein
VAFVLEDGSGVTDANAYCSLDFADAYHAERGNAAWAAIGTSAFAVLPGNPDAEPSTFTFASAHGLVSGQRVRLDTTGTLYSGLYTTRYYYAVVEYPNSIKIAQTYVNAVADTPITETFDEDTGTGTHSVLVQPLKEQAIVRASDFMEHVYGSRWLGERSTDTQGLHWPAAGAYLWRTGESLPDDDALTGVPVAVQRACAEYALRALERSLFPDASSGLASSESLTLPGLSRSVTYAQPGGMPRVPLAERYLRGYLRPQQVVR